MPPDPSRLDELDRTIQRLANDLAEARRELASFRLAEAAPAPRPVDPPPAGNRDPSHEPAHEPLREPPPRAESPPPPRPASPHRAPPRPARPEVSAEQLVGRYGALGVGVVMVVMGAGALVSWAIRHGMLGPWVRVALGALLSGGLAVTGLRLRERARGFGNAMLALSLAVLHVVAWGAGPRLGLVPSWFALAVADVASVALAALAVKEEEQTLFAVGLGGALVAPFVMSSGAARYGILGLYGLIVLGAGIRTIGARAWWTAVGIIVLFTLVYTGSATGFESADSPWLTREFAGLFAGAIALIALFAERRPSRPWMGAAASFAMAVALVSHRAIVGSVPRGDLLAMWPDVPVVAFAGAVITLAVVRDFRDTETFAWFFGVAALPSLLLLSALHVTRDLEPVTTASVMIVAWAMLYGVASRFENGSRRGVLLALAGVASLGALASALRDYPNVLPVAAALHAIVFAYVASLEEQPPALAASALSVIVAFLVSVGRIETAHGFTNTPFLSLQSLGAASAVLAAYVSPMIGLPPRSALFGGERTREAVAASVAFTLAFVWGWVELGHAISADASTFLRIVYLALWGVGAIIVGRRLQATGLRQIGLVLALLAALRAVVQASTVNNVALRVGSYLGAGAFLLGVAWLYRTGPKGEDAEPIG